MSQPIENIVIAGGGLIGWAAAAILSNSVIGKTINVTVLNCSSERSVDDMDAQALLATSSHVHKLMGIQESSLILNADATFKLANHYKAWCSSNQSFYHTQNAYGMSMDSIDFHQILNKGKHLGHKINIDDFSLAAVAAKKNKFAHPRPHKASERKPMFDPYAYSLNVNADKYCGHLKKATVNVTEIHSSITHVNINEQSGYISSVSLSNGDELKADFFFDATGESRTLVGQMPEITYHHWDKYLPCDSVLSCSIDAFETIPSSIEMSLHDYGWQKVIPLQNEAVVEFYFASKYLSKEKAQEIIRKKFNLSANKEMNLAEYKPGKISSFWTKNCIALGASAGSVENFVVSNLHLAQSAILRFLDFYPLASCHQSLADEYNRITNEEYDRILDFHSAHYALVKKGNTAFWQNVHTQQWPASLNHKLTLFQRTGLFPFYERETFSKNVWIAFLIGFDVWPNTYGEFLDAKNYEALSAQCENIRKGADTISNHMPTQSHYLNEYIKACSTAGSNRA